MALWDDEKETRIEELMFKDAEPALRKLKAGKSKLHAIKRVAKKMKQIEAENKALKRKPLTEEGVLRRYPSLRKIKP